MEIQNEDQTDDRNEEMERLYAETFQGIEVGAILQGTVISAKHDGVIVDVGYKSEGIIRAEEFTSEEIDDLNPGDLLEVFVVSIADSEGLVVLSRDRAVKIKSWGKLEDIFKDSLPIDGVICEKTKGGAFVDINGIKAFLPGSHIDLRPVKDIDSLIGQKVTVKIIKLNHRRSNIIVSRRLQLEQERESKKSETLEKLEEGVVLNGIVKNITDYGVFIDLGGIDGLLHISDISWGRISHPSKHFEVGQDVEIVVLNFDPESEKVTLGYKQKMPDPWAEVDVKYPIGSRVSGKVVSLTEYGAFVEVEEALEGLVHASEIEWAPRPKHPSKYLNVGDEVEAVVLKADKNERRLSLSLKQLKPSPWELVSERYREGEVIEGKVRGITDFGVFVGLPEGVDGLVHISDISWTKHIKHPSDVYKKGDDVKAVILSVEPQKERIALGIKQMAEDPWKNDIPQRYTLGDEFECEVLRTTEFGVFVELEGEVEGLVYASEVPEELEDDLNEGRRINARIIKVDLANKKIGLSLKDVSNIMVESDVPDDVAPEPAEELEATEEEVSEPVEELESTDEEVSEPTEELEATEEEVSEPAEEAESTEAEAESEE
ncbi:MAG: 30S ribosomal protein S1 [Thermodesulfovibrionales bacterium]|nr:30S ribosomal protein S1 [Thermodesulfovibrionales bacterium]